MLATVVQFGDAPKLPKSLSSLLRGRGGGAQTSDSEETLTGHPGEPAALGPTGAAVPSELRRPGAEERVAAGFVEPGTSVAGTRTDSSLPWLSFSSGDPKSFSLAALLAVIGLSGGLVALAAVFPISVVPGRARLLLVRSRLGLFAAGIVILASVCVALTLGSS